MVVADLREGAMRSPSASKRGPVVLALGAGVGILLAATGLLDSRESSGRSVPEGAAALVNGSRIRLDDYRRAVAGLAEDRREGLAGGDEKRVLDRLIDEELLIQRGLELGLSHSDRRVRADLTSAVIDSIVAGADAEVPTDVELERFYAEHRETFTGAGRLRLRVIFCAAPTLADAPAALERANDAARRLRAGEDFGAVATALGDPEVSPLPDAALPPAKLLDYLGPTALRAALALGPGAVGDPVRSGQGYHVLQLLAREHGAPPAFAEVRSEVLREYRRRAGEEAVRAYLKELRGRAAIEVRSDLR